MIIQLNDKTWINIDPKKITHIGTSDDTACIFMEHGGNFEGDKDIIVEQIANFLNAGVGFLHFIKCGIYVNPTHIEEIMKDESGFYITVPGGEYFPTEIYISSEGEHDDFFDVFIENVKNILN